MRLRRRRLPPPDCLHLTPEQVAAMRQAGRLVARAHAAVQAAIAPGVALRDLNALAEEAIRQGGGRPAFLGVKAQRPGVPPFPGAACLSLNEAVVHGLPSRRHLAEGDLLSVDLGAEWAGHFGDSAWTWPVGEVAPLHQRLLAAGQAALWAGVAQARAGASLNAVSGAIEDAVAASGFALAEGYGGHGIGRVLHGWPHVPNERDPGGAPTLARGQGLAIEPMLCTGSGRVRTLADGWTVATADGGWAVHFEHSLLVTEGAPELLTGWAEVPTLAAHQAPGF